MKTNRGQAILEYVLLLAVAVAIIGALIYKFSEEAQKFGDSIVGPGGLLACSMQTGLLPTQASSGLCSSTKYEMQDVSLSTSSSTTTGGGSSGASSGGDSNTGTSTGTSTPVTTKKGGGGSTQTSNLGGGNKSSRGRGLNRPLSSTAGDIHKANRGPINNQVASSSDYGEGLPGKKRKGIKLQKAGGLAGDPGYGGQLHTTILQEGYFSEGEMGYEKRGISRAVSSAGKTAKNKKGGKEKTAGINNKTKIKDRGKDIDGGFSFGNLLRFFIIFIIIAGIAFLIYSQTSQVKKGLKS